MKSRNFVMLAMVAVVAAGAWHVTQRNSPTTEFATAMLYPGLIDQLNDSQQLAIASSDGTVTVVRDGERWQVKEFDDYPASVAMVKQVLLQLASLKILETKTSKPEKYAQLGVEDRNMPGAASRGVQVVTQNGETTIDLLVGKERPARATNPPGHYVRRAGEASAYLVEGELTFGAKPTEWIDTSVVNIPVERVRQVTIQPQDGAAVVVSKASPEVQLYTLANLPAGHEVRARATVSSMGGLLLDARLEKVVAASKLAAQVPRAVATVETFDGLTAVVEQFEFENAAYMTFKFTHTPEKAVTPPPTAAPAAQIAKDSAIPVVAPLKTRAEVAQEVSELNSRVTGWAYGLPDYKSRLFEKKLVDLTKKKSPPGDQPTPGAKK